MLPVSQDRIYYKASKYTRATVHEAYNSRVPERISLNWGVIILLKYRCGTVHKNMIEAEASHFSPADVVFVRSVASKGYESTKAKT